MRLSYNRYNITSGLVKVRTKTALVLSALAITLGGGGLSLARLIPVHAVTPTWNVNGVYTLDFEYGGAHYVHDATISGQDGAGNFMIEGGYAAGAAVYDYEWNGTGNVAGTTLTMSTDYTVGAPGTHMDMTGTIAPDGTLSGTWTDNFGGARAGTWTSATGVATQTSDAEVVVTTANPHGWVFVDDNGNGGSGSFVAGPETPPLGVGSAQLGVNASNQGYLLGAALYGGTKLADVAELTYSTYVQTGNNLIAPSLQLNIDRDSTDAITSWQGRLVYEPYFAHTVVDGEWQTWNTQDNAADGNWWFSNGGLASASGCAQANPCTWDEVLAAFPNVNINANAPGVGFKAGSGWTTAFVGNVDAFVFGTTSGKTTYNFEPYVAVTDKEACKNNGWKTAVNANGTSFKNQGACVSYVASNGKSQH